MKCTHPQPITEGSAAVQPCLHGDLKVLLEFFYAAAHFSLADLQTLCSENKCHDSTGAPLNAPPPPHTPPQHHQAPSYYYIYILAFSHHHLSGGNDSTYITTSIRTNSEYHTGAELLCGVQILSLEDKKTASLRLRPAQSVFVCVLQCLTGAAEQLVAANSESK